MKYPMVSRRKEILRIGAEINAKETKETIAEINKAKSWFLEKINKIDKPLARLIKKQREMNQINKIRNENGEITTDNTEIQRPHSSVLAWRIPGTGEPGGLLSMGLHRVGHD